MILPFQIDHAAALWFITGFYVYWLGGVLADALPTPGPQSKPAYLFAHRFITRAAANFGSPPPPRPPQQNQEDKQQ